MSKDPWESVEVSEAPEGWLLATETGCGALVVWAAGTGNFVRLPALPRDRDTVVVAHFPDGSQRREASLLTDAELQSIDDDIDSYLGDAGLPTRPRGYNWFIRCPPNADIGADTFWATVWTATMTGLVDDAVRPSQLKDAARQTLASIYRG
jgi:hypothetical protein